MAFTRISKAYLCFVFAQSDTAQIGLKMSSGANIWQRVASGAGLI